MAKHLKTAFCVFAFIFIAGGSAFALARHQVDQSGLKFSTALLNIQRGDTIVFANNDRVSHNITIRGGAMNFDGGLQRPGGNVEVPFTKAGDYQVMCGIHPRMRMQIEVH